MKPNLKLARQDDISLLLGMMERFYAIDNYPFNRETASSNLRTFIDNDQLGRLWVIHFDNTPIGYLALTFGFSFEYGGRDAFIDELFIEENFRNLGIGSEAMHLVEQEAVLLDVKAIHLEVEKNNATGNRIYLKQGYTSNDRTLLTKSIDRF
jgi:ribosomal protein S18 acetylase RimI-like enzyme